MGKVGDVGAEPTFDVEATQRRGYAARRAREEAGRAGTDFYRDLRGAEEEGAWLAK